MEGQPAGSASEGTTASSTSGKVAMLPLVIAVCIAAMCGTALTIGAALWGVKSGRVSFGAKAPAQAPREVEVPTKLIPLDPLLVNLADEGGRAYLRIGLTLKVENPPAEKESKKEAPPEKGAQKNENEAAERDVALGVLGRASSVQLLAQDGKQGVKHQLTDAYKVQIPEAKITDVLITEFLVQR